MPEKTPHEHLNPLVSVIIPCFNAEKWVGEAIESCLNQSYKNIEIIVVDDGSNDESLEVVEMYKDKVSIIRQDHRGVCEARNKGTLLARGVFIQYLDADDYLFPEKIARQVEVMSRTNADIIYGDWRHELNIEGQKKRLGEIKKAGVQQDFLESMLRGWWFAVASFMIRKSFLVEHRLKWDEDKAPADDHDFLLRAAINKPVIAYIPVCQSVYRRHGDVTLSTSNRRLWLDAHLRTLVNIENILLERSVIEKKYKKAMAGSYFFLARNYFRFDSSIYDDLIKKVNILCSDFVPEETILYNLTWRFVGFKRAEQLALLKSKMKRWLGK